jgi:hypothetical protein
VYLYQSVAGGRTPVRRGRLPARHDPIAGVWSHPGLDTDTDRGGTNGEVVDVSFETGKNRGGSTLILGSGRGERVELGLVPGDALKGFGEMPGPVGDGGVLGVPGTSTGDGGEQGGFSEEPCGFVDLVFARAASLGRVECGLSLDLRVDGDVEAVGVFGGDSVDPDDGFSWW